MVWNAFPSGNGGGARVSSIKWRDYDRWNSWANYMGTEK